MIRDGPPGDDARSEPTAGRRGGSRIAGDDRGVSFTVSYALSVAIATLLVAGVVATAGFVLQEQRESTVRDQLTVVGNDVAATVMAADRLAAAGNDSNLTVRRPLPAKAIDGPYTITLRAVDGDASVTVQSDSPAVTVDVPLRNRTAVANASVTGGTVVVVYRASTDELTLEEGSR